MNNSEAFPVSKTSLEKTLYKAYQITKEPLSFYPTVEMIDEFLESEEFKEIRVQEDLFKFFVLCIISGFTRDKLWHKAHPDHRHITFNNLYLYLTTPLEGEDAYSLHAGVWSAIATEEEKEDRQAAFEYMQSIIMDTSMFVIVDDVQERKYKKRKKSDDDQ